MNVKHEQHNQTRANQTVANQTVANQTPANQTPEHRTQTMQSNAIKCKHAGTVHDITGSAACARM